MSRQPKYNVGERLRANPTSTITFPEKGMIGFMRGQVPKVNPSSAPNRKAVKFTRNNLMGLRIFKGLPSGMVPRASPYSKGNKHVLFLPENLKFLRALVLPPRPRPRPKSAPVRYYPRKRSTPVRSPFFNPAPIIVSSNLPLSPTSINKLLNQLKV